MSDYTDAQYELLAELVHDQAGQIASNAINSGEEVNFLLSHGWTMEEITERITLKASPVRVRFTPEAWVRDYAVEVDRQGDDEWLVSEETAGMIVAALATVNDDLDFVREDELAPAWIKAWHGPFTIHQIAGLMCENCRDAVTREASEWVGSDGEVTCPDTERPHGPAVPDTASKEN